MKTLIIVAHPDLASSRLNSALLASLPESDTLNIHSLYDEYPSWEIDVTREQALLLEHERIVLQFPMYWYSTPPLLKKWQDDVLTFGWAYGPGGTQLAGKQLLPSTTTGGNPVVYRAGGRNHYTIDELLRPLQATANKCGMQYLPPFVTGGHLDDNALGQTAERFRSYVLTEWPA